MARVKAETLCRREENYQTTEILKAEGVYAVYYRGQPINVKRSTIPGQDKYLRVAFPAPGYARSMARRLNKLFDTDEFTVHSLVKDDDNGRDSKDRD